jgi:hypothetical protein
MACKRSGVRIPIAPLRFIFPGQGLAHGGPRVGSPDSCGPGRGSDCGICAGHRHLRHLRPSLAYPASEPGRTAALLASGVLAVQVRFYGWAHAACVISDLWREPRREHAATSQEAPRAVLRTVQVPVRRPSAGVADCPALAGAAFQGPTFLAYLRGDSRLLGGRDAALTRGRPCRACGSSDRYPGRFPGIRSSSSD